MAATFHYAGVMSIFLPDGNVTYLGYTDYKTDVCVYQEFKLQAQLELLSLQEE